MNFEYVKSTVETQIKRYLGNRKAIVGISGGIDSAVVASLCVNALGRDNVIGIQMPYGEQSTKDGSALLAHLEIKDIIVNIKHIVQSFPLPLLPSIDQNADLNRMTNGNVRARVRMTLLYAYAGSFNGMVIGTSNKTEIMLGYFTKYGDGGCDIEPIGDIYKTDVFGLAKILGIPEAIITKKPSAELWEGQTDEGEIGMTYAEIDEMFRAYLKDEMINLRDFYEKYGRKGEMLIQRYINTEHKRRMPPVFFVGE